MNPFESETLRLIFIFFVPGFISIKVYDLLVPTEKRDFSKDMFEAISYSCINFAILFWVIFEINSTEFQPAHPFLYYLATVFILFVAPIIWPIAFLRIISIGFIRKRIIDPFLKPWDRLFSRKRAYWVIVHLKGGRKIGGRYGRQSSSSSYPAEEQIYIEELWQIDQKTGRFIAPIPQTQGALISSKNYVFIELFR
jgi:hypothetical protein